MAPQTMKKKRVGGSKVTRRPRATASKSEPRTAYELLQRVCRAMTPKTYCQAMWMVAKPHREFYDLPAVKGNECGTAYCRAGWIIALHDGHDYMRSRPGHYSARAAAILGVSEWSVDYLFDGGAIKKPAGTRDYVREGVRGLREFMRRNASHLKARLLKDVPPPKREKGSGQ